MGCLRVLYLNRVLIEFDVRKSCFRFCKSLLRSYLNDLGLIKPDGLKSEILAEFGRRARVRAWLEVGECVPRQARGSWGSGSRVGELCVEG